MGRRELRVLAVIERRTRPGGRIVAVLAGRWEKLRLRRVPGVRRVLVIRLVTAVASRGQRRVIAVDVAIGTMTWRHSVRSGQRKCSVVVIEG